MVRLNQHYISEALDLQSTLSCFIRTGPHEVFADDTTHRDHLLITPQPSFHRLSEIASTQAQTSSITCCHFKESMTRDGKYPTLNNIIIAFWHNNSVNFPWRSLYETWPMTCIHGYKLLNFLITPNPLFHCF